MRDAAWLANSGVVLKKLELFENVELGLGREHLSFGVPGWVWVRLPPTFAELPSKSISLPSAVKIVGPRRCFFSGDPSQRSITLALELLLLLLLLLALLPALVLALPLIFAGDLFHSWSSNRCHSPAIQLASCRCAASGS